MMLPHTQTFPFTCKPYIQIWKGLVNLVMHYQTVNSTRHGHGLDESLEWVTALCGYSPALKMRWQSERDGQKSVKMSQKSMTFIEAVRVKNGNIKCTSKLHFIA